MVEETRAFSVFELSLKLMVAIGQHGTVSNRALRWMA
jgi:hypothetical protein